MAKQTKNYSAEIFKLADGLAAKIAELEASIQAIDTHMAELQAAGLIYATEHWRKDGSGKPKFMYLLYPSRAGEKRRRDYIGSDDAKVAQARAGMERAKEFDRLANQQRQLIGRVYSVGDDLKRAYLHLSGGRPGSST